MGFSEALFWSSTPRQIATHFEGAAQRSEREQRGRMSLAWHIVALDRTKRLPKLTDLIGQSKKAPLQSWQGMRDIARAITVMHGGTITTRKG